MNKARLIFPDGKVFFGKVFAEGKETTAEVVFNTAMTGYQEILTDPSYSGQIVVMTYPLIGNYGVNDEDVESRKIFVEGLIVREYVDTYSNWRAKKSLKTYLEDSSIIGIEEMDTRAITRYIRDTGAKKALLTTSDESIEKLVADLGKVQDMVGANLAKVVTCEAFYLWKKPESQKFEVAVIDCGVKHNILELLREQGCLCTVFPASVTAEQILEKGFDGVFISNGPGDPEPVETVATLIRELINKLPLFGICLGHQILCLALGGKSYKLKFGHHGANHPIMNLATKKVEITAQNHGFAIEADSIDTEVLKITHMNLNDNTVAGVEHIATGSFSLQYHPEAAPGPHDAKQYFQQFSELMEKKRS